MDRQVPDHENPAIADGYPFAPSSDSFNTFQTDDHDTTFNSSWYNHGIPNQTPAYLQGNDAWHSNGNPLHASTYGAPPGGYDRVYSRSPASFNYPGYDPRRSQTYSQPAYNPTSGYTNGSVTDGSPYGYSNIHQSQPPANHGQTISPQILQNFLNPYGQQHFAPEIRQAQQAHVNSKLARQNGLDNGSEHQIATVSSLVAAALPPSSPHGELLIKSAAGIYAMNRQQALRQIDATAPILFKGSLFALKVPNVEHISQIPSIKDRDKNRDKALRSPARIKILLQRVYGTPKWNDRHHYIQRKLCNLEDKYAGIITAESMSPSSMEDDSDEDGSDDSDSDDERNLQDINPLPLVRPSDPVEAVKYDVIKAVWAKHSLGLSGTIIRTALGNYSDVLNVIRNQWKAAQAALAETEESTNQAGVTEAKARLDQQREIMKAAATTTLEHGHQDILEKLGEVPALALVLNFFLQDSAKEGIWSGSLIQTLLEASYTLTVHYAFLTDSQLLEGCKTVDKAWLEKCKLDKLLLKLVKKGTKPVIEYAQKILQSANARSAQKEPQVGDHDAKGVKAPGIGPASPSGRTPEPVSGVKRQRSVDSQNAQPTKKLAFNPISSRDEVPPKALAKGRKTDLSKKADTNTGTKPATGPPPKIKSTHVAPKPTNFFSSLQSASKKPGTSNAALQSAKVKDGKPSIPLETKASIVPATASKPTFSFAETMANLNKPKEPTSVKSEDVRPPETDEEKAKRLRRESRRSLRVSFKPDDSLVEVRTFIHDPDEELGHDDSMVRDVGDLRQEGQTLKMHRDLDVPDDEDDTGLPDDLLIPWALPSMVDFSVVSREERERNYRPRGGDVIVKSQERAVQEQRESNALMVIYTTDSDIPSSPREPSDPYSGEPATEVSFGAVPDEIKAREAQYYSARDPYYRQNNEPAAPPSQTPDISALLRALNGQQQQQQQQQQQLLPQQSASQASTSGLEAIFARFANNNQQTASMQVPQSVQQPPSVPPFNLQAMLGAMKQQNNQTPQGYTIPPPPSQVTDLSAILAQFGQQQPAVQSQTYNYGNTYQSDTRKRQSDYEDQRDGKRQKPIPEKKVFYGVPRVPCKFFQEGSCRKGDKCTFLHE